MRAPPAEGWQRLVNSPDMLLVPRAEAATWPTQAARDACLPHLVLSDFIAEFNFSISVQKALCVCDYTATLCSHEGRLVSAVVCGTR